MFLMIAFFYCFGEWVEMAQLCLACNVHKSHEEQECLRLWSGNLKAKNPVPYPGNTIEWMKWVPVLFWEIKRPGRCVDHPPPTRAEVKERELQIYFLSEASWPFRGRLLPFTLRIGNPACIFNDGPNSSSLLDNHPNFSLNVQHHCIYLYPFSLYF